MQCKQKVIVSSRTKPSKQVPLWRAKGNRITLHCDEDAGSGEGCGLQDATTCANVIYQPPGVADASLWIFNVRNLIQRPSLTADSQFY